MEGHGSSWKVMESHGRSLPFTRLTFQVRKVMVGGCVVGVVVVACRIMMSAPVPFLWTLDLGFGIGLDKNMEFFIIRGGLELTI